MHKTKAPSLKTYKAKQIGRYAENNPHIPITEVATKYKVTYNQAYNAVKRYRQGKFSENSPRSKKIDTGIIKAKTDADTLLERQYHQAVAQLEADENMPADQRIALLDKLFSARKILQQVRLESHIKKTDASIVASIVRRYEPDASDERIIEVYREELEKWKISQK